MIASSAYGKTGTILVKCQCRLQRCQFPGERIAPAPNSAHPATRNVFSVRLYALFILRRFGDRTAGFVQVVHKTVPLSGSVEHENAAIAPLFVFLLRLHCIAFSIFYDRIVVFLLFYAPPPLKVVGSGSACTPSGSISCPTPVPKAIVAICTPVLPSA